MNADAPKCPRCKDGGNVKLVTEEENKAPGVFDPAPAHSSKSQLFQCTCGWTLVRTRPKPPDGKHDDVGRG
jgi:hypothetical protein